MWKRRRVILWARGAWAEMCHSWRTDDKREFFRKHLTVGWHLAGFLILRALGMPPYPGWRRRLRACSRCPVFHRKLMTCGKPGQMWFNPDTQQMEQRGCLCPLRLKVQIADAPCWDPNEDHWADL